MAAAAAAASAAADDDDDDDDEEEEEEEDEEDKGEDEASVRTTAHALSSAGVGTAAPTSSAHRFNPPIAAALHLRTKTAPLSFAREMTFGVTACGAEKDSGPVPPPLQSTHVTLLHSTSVPPFPIPTPSAGGSEAPITVFTKPSAPRPSIPTSTVGMYISSLATQVRNAGHSSRPATRGAERRSWQCFLVRRTHWSLCR